VIGFIYHDRVFQLWLTLFLPKNIGMLIVLLLVNILSNQIHNSLKTLFNINLAEGKFTDLENYGKSIKRAKLAELFKSEDEFNQYRYLTFNTFYSVSKNGISIIIGFFLAFSLHFTTRFTNLYLPSLGSDPYPVPAWDLMYLIIGNIQLIFQWIIFSGLISSIFILFGFAKITSTIGRDGNFYIKNMNYELLDIEDNLEDDLYLKKTQVANFSIIRFRRRCNNIPQALVPINLLLLLIIVLSSSAVYYLASFSEDKEYPVLILFTILMVFILVDVYLFLYPQFAIYRIIKNKISISIDLLEEYYENKKLQWLNLDMSLEDSNDKQSVLWNEMKALTNFIEELYKINPWPFNYKQIVTIIGSIILSILILIDILNFVSIIEILLTN
ncbi:MAG: hypothetical protein OEZ01_05920, partial [Candidatus Heimdallarchaeota archaeon]|nr:hypothetical protein [Candidatus Heimdallarchaeota archaeon]